jgi:predicted ArsR family transcriptional regulator
MIELPSLYVISVSAIAWSALVVFYVWGKVKGADESTEEAIEKTIVYLVKEGYVKYTRDQNGEIELHKLNDENY